MRLTRAIKLRDRVRDTITGFEGVAVAKTEWMNGCVRWSIQPTTLKDGKPIDAEWFDEQQVERVTAAAERPRKATGGPQRDPRF